MLIVIMLDATMLLRAQVVTVCPQNIGFESGTFRNWNCYAGSISETGRNAPNAVRPATIQLSASQPFQGRHTLINKGSGFDRFGGFSTDSPNGSDYVIMLGNSSGGRGAESISYNITVPSNVEVYSIIFNYAVVLENPSHDNDEQPKFTARVTDVDTGESTECGSFEFVAPGASGGIPGFMFSSVSDSVLYKPWSPVMVNLSDYIGHTIRLQFTTNDCSRGAHFGYAYLDFNENCSIPITGNITCPEVSQLTLKAIPGMARYNWFNAETQEPLGNSESIVVSPVPPLDTKIGVELIPYAGLGCPQTLYTTVSKMYMNFGTVPETCASANLTATYLTAGNSSDLTYSYWKDAETTISLEDPAHVRIEGTYYVKGTSSSGCNMVLPVFVDITDVKLIVVIEPAPVLYPTTVDITKFFVRDTAFTYTFWTDANCTKPLLNPGAIRFSGTFYIRAQTDEGCTTSSPITVTVDMPDFVIPNTFTPNADGVNDVFTILTSNSVNVTRFSIFNRWGRLMYATSDITQYWKGLKDSQDVPVGVYYWILEGDQNKKFFRKTGWVTVIR